MTRDGERLRVARQGSGWAAWGAGFYVWREDAGELRRDAAALAGPGESGQGARRARASSASRRRASIAAR
jgi:hypothetical protein